MSEGHNRSLVVRLVRSAILWALPILILTAVTLTLFYRSSTYRIFDDPLVSAVTSLIASIEFDEGSDSLSAMRLVDEPTDPRYQRALSGRYWIIGTLGNDGGVTPVRASRSMLEERVNLPPKDVSALRANPGDEIISHATGPDGEPLRVRARYVSLPNMASSPVIVLAAADSRPAMSDVRRFAGLASFLMALLSLGLVVAVMTQVRSGLKPLFDLRDRVVDVREGRATRVEGLYPPEIQPLATELNGLIDHNKTVVDRAQTHVGNLAHALKTPLAILRNEGDAPSNRAALIDLVTRQTEIMRKQVDHHLRRARAAARGHAIGASTDVAEILDSLARTLPRIYRNKDIDITLEIEPDLIFRGEKRDLEEMAGNVMDNACKWTTARVEVQAVPHPIDPALFLICIEDDGPGLRTKDFATALKRGVRLDEATPGTGLGLSIVDDLAQAYRGDVTLSRSPLGGLHVTLTLPRRLETNPKSG